MNFYYLAVILLQFIRTLVTSLDFSKGSAQEAKDRKQAVKSSPVTFDNNPFQTCFDMQWWCWALVPAQSSRAAWGPFRWIEVKAPNWTPDNWQSSATLKKLMKAGPSKYPLCCCQAASLSLCLLTRHIVQFLCVWRIKELHSFLLEFFCWSALSQLLTSQLRL